MKPFLFLLLATASLAQQPKPAPAKLSPEVTAGLEAHPGLVYAHYGQREMQLALWKPKTASQPLPAILCIHGGGWYKGERSSMANLAQALAAKGFVSATISYRLSGEAKFPAAIQDCKAAVRFLRANAAKFGIDANAIGVTGLSAGGHLAALLTTSGGVKALEGDGGHADQSSAVQACIAMGDADAMVTGPVQKSIINDAGNVLGLMPHPERLIEPAQGGTDGRAMFEAHRRSPSIPAYLIADARALLQVMLIHLGEGCGLRETAARASLAGIAQVKAGKHGRCVR